MVTTSKPRLTIYVDKDNPEHWVVRDGEGRFWAVPSGDNAWENRKPICPDETVTLEPVPGHYSYMLGLPVGSA